MSLSSVLGERTYVKRVDRLAWIAIAGFLAVLQGCAKSAPPPSPPPPVEASKEPAIPVYDVPALSRFRVSLVRPLGTRLSTPGDSFRAKVLSPLVTLRGYTLVPVGAELRGRVVAVEQAPSSRIRLKFESVMTRVGPAKLWATLDEAQPDPSFTVRPAQRVESDYDVTLDGVAPVPLGGSAARSAAPSRSDIRLPAKTQLELVLVHPLQVKE